MNRCVSTPASKLAFLLVFAAAVGGVAGAQTAPPAQNPPAQNPPAQNPPAQLPPPQPIQAEIHGTVVDEDGHPVDRVEVTARWGTNEPVIVYSDAVGDFKIPSVTLDRISIVLNKPGFYKVEDPALHVKAGVNNIPFALSHEQQLEEQVNVSSTATQIDPDTTSHEATIDQKEIIDTPVASTHDLQQSLVTIPNVVQDTGGTLHVAGARQGQTEVLLDGFEVNDPANGTYAPQMDVDAVETTTVQSGGYGAQYSHAAAGILEIDTYTGDDKWRFGITNFIPSADVQDGFHFGTWFPRMNFSGPIKKGRAWFSMASSVQHSYVVIGSLPSGQNLQTSWAGDNLLRFQFKITPKNIFQANFLYNQSSQPQFGLGPFSPLSTTQNRQANRSFVSLRDQVFAGRTLFQFGLAGDTGHVETTPQGDMAYIVQPAYSLGNYFQTQSQTPQRLQLVGDIITDSVKFWGTHTFSEGWNVDGVDVRQSSVRNEIQYEEENGTLTETATFTGPSAFRISNTQIGGYAQDQWRLVKPLVFSVGVRVDWDRLIQQALVQPRLAMNWVPLGDGRMKITVAWGEHYQPLNLLTFGQAFDQERISTFYDAAGTEPLGPPVTSAFLLPHGGLLQGRSYNSTAEWEMKVRQDTLVGAAYLLRQGENGLAWEFMPDESFLLQSNRNDYFESEEAWIRHDFGDKAEITVDYVHEIARSNEVLDPTLFTLLLSPQQGGRLPWDAPNRIVTHGWTPLPAVPKIHWHLLLSYFFEYHTGFPYSAVNDELQLVGAPDTYRFPTYYNLNVGLEKEFRFRNREWAIRVSSNNITGHDNPLEVVNNIDAPNFGAFYGGTGRALTARIRLITAK
jgi:hypothetical protein